MPPAAQVKLLRVLEEREFYRVGGVAPIKVDVRVRGGHQPPAQGRGGDAAILRDDLFYRLNVLSIYLPAAAGAPQRHPAAGARGSSTSSASCTTAPSAGIEPAALQLLVDAPWPGNVRQLRNLIESMVVLAPTSEIRPEDIPREVREQGRERLLPVRVPGLAREVAGQELTYIVQSLLDLRLQVEDLRRRLDEHPQRVEVIEVPHALPEHELVVEEGTGSAGEGAGSPYPFKGREAVIYEAGMSMADVERAAIEAALAHTRGNRRKAAEMLGIGERTLYRKLKEYEAPGGDGVSSVT